MFVSIEQFIQAWQNESKATERVMDLLNDQALSQAITPESRTLGQIAWHIATSIHEMLSRTGLEFPAPEGEEMAPQSAQFIAQTYRDSSSAIIQVIKNQWTDEHLAQLCDMYGEQWPNGLTLHILIQHEIHHRGQMTVLMRQAGLRVPSIYGPTREDWLQQGMSPLL
ncbi:DinB family protein [Paenibacillus turpanensis]|uniref:DinB family protein n=1 Tax=Paenibacillus turpanensis TaxID=2689078 RepID=UPI001409E0E1|nr:DinB family protein [Paenibacillus turpanensis]